VKRVFVIGLDCAAPELVFDQWRNVLPNLSRLAAQGLWGELQSCTPAITVPAWSSMLTSRDPGVLGVYGFRNRADHSYDRMTTAMSNAVRYPRVWDFLGQAGKQSIIIGVPQTFPVAPLAGYLISDFLTPNRQSQFTFPPEFAREVLQIAPEYDFDVKDFRTDDKAWLLKQIYAMTENRFNVIDNLLTSKPWDFFMFVEIGVDRIHHGFWSNHDPAHFKYQKGNAFEHAIRDYYIYIDRKIGAWLARLPENTAVLVVSDHGAKRMDGGICINEWLWRNGYLALKAPPPAGSLTPLEKLQVDWSKTVAWGSGGYYARLFINVQGREPQGIVPAEQYEAVRNKLAHALAAIPNQHGQSIGTVCFRPEDIYQSVNGIAPDLIIYFGNLLWRSVGSMGHGGIYTFENDTGPDDCNHAQNGMFILVDPERPTLRGHVRDAQLMDIAPTLLELLGVPVPAEAGMQGRSLVTAGTFTDPYSHTR
jgi:predicted AlkP superfamily phosphohydrolase/phosphomutase